MTARNRFADRQRRERFASTASLDKQRELITCVEALHLPRRVVTVIPDPVLIAVRVEDDGPLPELPLECVGVEARLLLADVGVFAGALRLDESEWHAVVAPEHVVDETLAALGVVRHTGDRKLDVARIAESPAGLAQQQVDEQAAGLVFAVVVGVDDVRVGCFRQRNLGSQGCKFCLKALVVRLGVGEHRVSSSHIGRELLQLHHALSRCAGLRLRQQQRIERSTRDGSFVSGACVVGRHPDENVKELAHDGQAVGGSQRRRAMHGVVALLADHIHLGEDAGAD